MAEEKTTKIKKKRWFQIIGPNLFRGAVLGETYAVELDVMLDKTLKINLMALTNDMKQQNVNMKFQIYEIRDNKAYTKVIGYEVIPATIKRLVRRGKKRMDISFVCETSDKVKIRVKPLLITKKTMKSSVNSALRKTIEEYLKYSIKKMNYENLVSNLMAHRLQHALKNTIRKIYPLRICEIREMSIVKGVAPEENAKELVKPKETSQKKEEKIKEAPKKEEKPEAEKLLDSKNPEGLETKEKKSFSESQKSSISEKSETFQNKEAKKEELKKEVKEEKKEEVKAEIKAESKEVSETQRVSEHAQKSTISDKKK